MLSRVADAIYWMSRYLERADNVARFINVNLQLSLDLRQADNPWLPLVTITGDQEAFDDTYKEASQENVIEFLVFDPNYDNSIVSCLKKARENAQSVRDVISTELWEQINYLYLLITSVQVKEELQSDPYKFFAKLQRSHFLLLSLSDNTMLRNEAWHFLHIGRMLERADKTSRILDVKYYILLPSISDVGSSIDCIQWAALLSSTNALELYRKSYGRITPDKVSEFLIFDRKFPRAINCCLEKAERSLWSISGAMRGTYHNEAERIMGKLRSQMSYITINEVFKQGLHEFIEGFQLQLNEIGDAITETFFMPKLMDEMTRQFEEFVQ